MTKRHMLVAAAIVLLVTAFIPSLAMAQVANEAETNASDVTMWLAITIGFGMAIASSICGYAQSRAVTAACEGMSRNPSASTARSNGQWPDAATASVKRASGSKNCGSRIVAN